MLRHSVPVHATSQVQQDHFLLLTTSRPSRRQRRLAAGVLAVLAAAVVATAPVAPVALANSQVFVPAYAIAVFIVDVITAALLLALFSVERSRAVLALSIGYLTSGLLVVPWGLAFPGVSASYGLPVAGLQATATLATFRLLGFPLFVLAYALMKDSRRPSWAPEGSTGRIIGGSVAAVVAIAGGLSWLVLTTDDTLPRFMQSATQVTSRWRYVAAAAVGLHVVSLVVLWIRRHSVLDLWLMVVLCTLLLQTVLLSYLSAGLRLSVGWWAGRLYGFISGSIVLLVLLSESVRLYARLVRATAAERRAREARLTAMEALSASVAHEVNQPLASMVTSANAGVHWLGRPEPNVAEAAAALDRIVTDGHRAAAVIEGIRTMFRKDAQRCVLVNINGLIEEVLRRCRGEVQLGRIHIKSELNDRLPHVTGSPVQLQQVISNLIANAVDAMSTVDGRERVLRVSSAPLDIDRVLVSVEDSGAGLDPNHKGRIFDPFFTTKPDGMGMGLMFCRSVVEAHGGQIWTMDNQPHGAVVQFTLPSARDSVSIASVPAT
jgi:signal transduction histidine kinase